MNDYRVQEYVLDMGAFGKRSIHEQPSVLYHNTNNNSRCRRLVILTPDDPFGANLPQTVRSWENMAALVRQYERMELERCRMEEVET